MLQDKKQIGRRIRLIRSGLGLNQKEFGEQLGVATSSVSAYEKGQTSRFFEVVAKIAKLDGLLTGGKADDPPHPDLYDLVKAEKRRRGNYLLIRQLVSRKERLHPQFPNFATL